MAVAEPEFDQQLVELGRQVVVQQVVVAGGPNGNQVIINGQPVQPAGQPADARGPGLYGVKTGPLSTTQPSK